MKEDFTMLILHRLEALDKRITKFEETITALLNRILQEDDMVMTTKMVCEKFHIDRKTLYNACERGELPYKQNKEGGKKWYLSADIKAWLAVNPHLL